MNPRYGTLTTYEQRHPFLRYQGLEYTDADIADFEERLERIYDRDTHRVQVVDFQVLVRWSQETYELEAVYYSFGITYGGGDGVPWFC
ncbi:hypothetical protein Tco_0428558 [Tanacetum coccineum]